MTCIELASCYEIKLIFMLKNLSVRLNTIV